MRKNKMKVYVTKVSDDFEGLGTIKEFPTLEDAVNTLISDKTIFKHFTNEPLQVIVFKPYKYSPEAAKSCDYIIELYDDWIE